MITCQFSYAKDEANPPGWSHVKYENTSADAVVITLSEGPGASPISKFHCRAGTVNTVGLAFRGPKFVSCFHNGQVIFAAWLIFAMRPLIISIQDVKVCNICGNTSFSNGPNGRVSPNGSMPCCEVCKSLERHRLLRALYSPLIPMTRKRRCLQFSMDQAIHAGWFMSYEVSVYGGRNSLDIQNIAREPGSYSYIICNHVLEHVEHDDLAVKELLRVLTDDGILQFAVPDPLHHKLTSDWGYPNPKNHGHYRTYGADLLRTRLSPLLQQSVLSVVAQDPVTSYEDVVYFCTKSPALRAELHRALTHYGFCPKEEELSS